MAINFKPHKYQEYAIEKIINNESYGLFLDMGLGKTVSTLTAIADLKLYLEIDKVLVIAPKRVADDTWSREVFKWEHTKHLKVSKVLGKEIDRLRALDADADIYVINRENTEWLVNHYNGGCVPFDMLVIDELSSFKSPSSNRFKALRKIRPLFKRFVGLTGTPAPNGLLDLWSQMYLIDRGERLGKTFTKYRQKYFYADRYNPSNPHVVFRYGLKEGAEETIYGLIDDVTVSMQAKDYLDLPDRLDNVIECEMDAKEYRLYKKLEKDRILEFFDGGNIVAENAAVLTQKLLQLANGASYDDAKGVQKIHNRKLDALESIIEESQGQPVLVFYNFKHDYDRIKRKFKNVVEIREEGAIERWNNGEISLLLAHPASAGHGLNLQDGGHIMVWFGLTWSLELYQQANARLHRQGQTETTIIHHIVTKDTQDYRVLEALQGKSDVQAGLLEALKAIQGEVNSEQD